MSKLAKVRLGCHGVELSVICLEPLKSFVHVVFVFSSLRQSRYLLISTSCLDMIRVGGEECGYQNYNYPGSNDSTERKGYR